MNKININYYFYLQQCPQYFRTQELYGGTPETTLCTKQFTLMIYLFTTLIHPTYPSVIPPDFCVHWNV